MSASLLQTFAETPGRARAFKRFEVDFTAIVEQASAEGSPAFASRGRKRSGRITAAVENISLNGLSFIAASPFPLDRLLLIDMTIGVRTFSLLAIVRRRRVTERPGGRVYETGVQFMKTEVTASFIPSLVKYLARRNDALSGAALTPPLETSPCS